MIFNFFKKENQINLSDELASFYSYLLDIGEIKTTKANKKTVFLRASSVVEDYLTKKLKNSFTK